MPRRLVPEDFWARVNRAGDDECWLWLGKAKVRGYGRISFQGRRWLTHRLSYTLTYGPIPDGLDALHTCDNRPCVNPHHLFLGTDIDNAHDCVAKGRRPSAVGSSNARAILDEDKVREARALFRPYYMTARKLAETYGVSTGTMKKAINGSRWTHVA